MKKAVIVLSGGIDSVCMGAILKSKYDLYGITFSYGQRANQEIKSAKKIGKILKLKEHKILDIGFMKNLYGESNVLTNSNKKMPSKFDYSIVVPIRNAVFLSIATAWAFTLNATTVAYGAHTEDRKYPDCRPVFTKKIESAFNQGEIDGIKKKIRKKIRIWSPYIAKISKKHLISNGYQILGDKIFETWSCYLNQKLQCGKCESCNNRKNAFAKAVINDQTKYLNN